MINIGVIGFGFAGRTFHAPVISAVAGLRLAAIVRRSGEKDPAYPDIKFVRSVDELLTDPNIRLVVIATPNTTHFSIASQCLLADRDVVVDKPFTTTVAEAQELVTLAKRKGRLISVYHNRRWDGDFLTVQQLLQESALGRIVLFESHFDRFRPQLRHDAWREKAEPGAGVLFDLGPHLIDQALMLFGLPEAVTADVRIERDGAAVDDAFDLVLHYPRMRALLRASMLAASAGPRFSIHGTRGSFVKYGLDPQEDALKNGIRPGSSQWGAEPPESWGKLTTVHGTKSIPTFPGDYSRFYENVRDSLLGSVEPSVTSQQALNVMRMLELAQQSSRERRTILWRI